MLKHNETITGRLESIDTNLAALNESIQRLEKNVASYLLKTVPSTAHAAQEEEKLEPLMDKQEVMNYLDIKETAYYRWVKKGKLKPRGGKGQHKYYPSDIKALMEQRKYRKRG